MKKKLMRKRKQMKAKKKTKKAKEEVEEEEENSVFVSRYEDDWVRPALYPPPLPTAFLLLQY